MLGCCRQFYIEAMATSFEKPQIVVDTYYTTSVCKQVDEYINGI